MIPSGIADSGWSLAVRVRKTSIKEYINWQQKNCQSRLSCYEFDDRLPQTTVF